MQQLIRPIGNAWQSSWFWRWVDAVEPREMQFESGNAKEGTRIERVEMTW